MKRFIFLVILLITSTVVYAESTDEHNILENLGQIYSEKLSDELRKIDMEGFIPDFNLQSIMKQASRGHLNITPNSVINSILNILFKEIFACSKLMLLLISLAILCSILTNLSGSLEASGISDIALIACTVIIIGISFSAFYMIVKTGQDTIENMVLFIRVLVPVLISVLISSGAVITAGIFQPWIIAAIEMTSAAIKDILIPLLMLSTGLNMIGCLSDKLGLSNLANLISKSVKCGVGILATIFIGMIGLESLTSSAVDSLGIRVAKFAVSSFVPVVGGILSDSVETVMGCGIVIKNALGVIGIIAVVIIASTSLAKLAAQLIIFKFSSALMQPIVDAKIVNCISSLADSLSIMFSLVSAVAVIFIISLTIAIHAGSSVMMLGR